MTDAYETWRRALEARDELADIHDEELDRIREQIRTELTQILRAGIDDIGRLPNQGRGLEARRRAEISWLGAVLEALGAPDA